MPFLRTTRKHPPRRCAYCHELYVPKTNNQKICGKLECKRRQHKDAQKRAASARPEHYRQMWKDNVAKRPRKTKAEPESESPFLPCPNCGYQCFHYELRCQRCDGQIDRKQAEQAKAREQKSYLDIVRENARRAGKDPKEAVRKAKGTNYIGEDQNRVLLDKLSAYLKKRGAEEEIEEEQYK